MSLTADVIVIGAGIMGNATAYQLAKAGYQVIVLEKGDVVGDGGSSRNGGGVRQSARDVRELPLAIYGVEHLWPTLGEELGFDVEYRQKGNLRLAKDEAGIEKLNQLASSSKKNGLKVDVIGADEVRQICPYFSDDIVGASWCPTDGHANPLMTTLAYYIRAREMGVQFITGEEVVTLQKVAGRVRRVVTETETYEADTVVLAAGFGSRRIAETVQLFIPMENRLLETYVTEAFPPMFEQMLGTADASFYGRQTPHGSFVLGCGIPTVFEYDKQAAGTSELMYFTSHNVLQFIPRLANVKVVRSWGGWMDLVTDGIPVIDAPEEVPGLILACGFSGHGFGIAPAVAQTVSEMVQKKEPTIQVPGLAYSRFEQWA
ncbi:MAG: FAD-binding oxidoreductase [Lawsonibacter sp.]|nr:FAD-binding oxidoreductase [Lawsonibacter sp.]